MQNLEIASYIDHTLLKPQSGLKEIDKLCTEALAYNFAAVCVLPIYVKYCKEALKNSAVKVATVVGFPLGASYRKAKALETELALLEGADEIDMVLNIANLIDDKWDLVALDIKGVVEKACGKCVKVIIETCYLSRQQKIKSSELAINEGANFVKTSTGFGPAGAKLEDVALLKSVIKERGAIKASGGIKTAKQAQAFIKAGAMRIGTSSGVKIMEELI